MKPMLAMLTLVLLVACGAEAVPPDPSPAPPVAAPAPASTAAATKLAQHFDRVTAKEITVVVAPSITVDQIARIRAADQQARSAMQRLRAQLPQFDARVLAAARAAVVSLEQTLDLASKDAAP